MHAFITFLCGATFATMVFQAIESRGEIDLHPYGPERRAAADGLLSSIIMAVLVFSIAALTIYWSPRCGFSLSELLGW